MKFRFCFYLLKLILKAILSGNEICCLPFKFWNSDSVIVISKQHVLESQILMFANVYELDVFLFLPSWQSGVWFQFWWDSLLKVIDAKIVCSFFYFADKIYPSFSPLLNEFWVNILDLISVYYLLLNITSLLLIVELGILKVTGGEFRITFIVWKLKNDIRYPMISETKFL